MKSSRDKLKELPEDRRAAIQKDIDEMVALLKKIENLKIRERGLIEEVADMTTRRDALEKELAELKARYADMVEKNCE